MTNPTTTQHAALPTDRWEHDLADKKPLYDAAEAKAEADRCLYCADAPCIKACPTSIDIPTFIKKIASGNVRGSARTILEQNLLGHSCARVCPVEVLCVGDCVLNHVDHKPIAIGRLQRYATVHGTQGAPLFVAKPRGRRKVALIGAGPASLACAGVLALAGVEAVIFEKRALPGGLNTTGIAPYKLHVEDALHEVDMVRSLGVEIRTGVELGVAGSGGAGTVVSAESLLAEYDAVFLGLGLGVDNRLGIPGEDGPGVMGATAWIESMKLAERASQPALGRVLVIGGGNTALDVARESALLGAEEVSLVYRRGEADMTGYAHELDGARTETVRLLPHRTPLAFERDAAGNLLGLRVRVTETGPGGREPREEVLPCELCAVAIGQEKLGALAAAFPGLVLDAKGRVDVSPSTRRSSHPKVYAGGDCINGGKEVVNAVADGRDAAYAMLKEFGDE